jgi:hypothetical protein
MKIAPLLIMAALVSVSGGPVAQEELKPGANKKGEQFVATVHVLAFESRGAFLGAPDVRLFESEEHKNLAGAFHGGVADHIPFGDYRIEAYLNGFYPETRYVSVFQRSVTVVVGLLLGREARILPVPPTLHGRISGPTPELKKTFVKAIGVYSNQSIESGIGPDGGFDLSIPQEGRYVLLVVNEDGVLASRTINSPYSGPPLEIEVGPSGRPAH